MVLAPKLKEIGHDLIILTNNKALKKSIKCDIRDGQKISRIVLKHNPDIIIHLAGITGNAECESNVKNALMTNVLGTQNILNASIKKRPKIIFASTREVYEETNKRFTEFSVQNPKNINGMTKLFSENIIQNFGKQFGLQYIILRFSNFVGEQNDRRGVSVMIKNAIQKNQITLFGGNQEIDLLHYNDAINSIISAVNYGNSGIFNIASGKSIKMTDLIKRIESKVGKKMQISKKPARKFESTYCRLHIQKAKKNLGFYPKEDIESILEKMIAKWSGTHIK